MIDICRSEAMRLAQRIRTISIFAGLMLGASGAQASMAQMEV